MRKEELELNQRKYMLELDRQTKEDARQEQKMKHEKIQLWISIGTASVTALLGLVRLFTFAGLTLNAQKHDYEDYQLESSSSKENRNNLLK